MTRKEQDTNRTSDLLYSGDFFHNVLLEKQMCVDASVAQTGHLRVDICFFHTIQHPGKQDIHGTCMRCVGMGLPRTTTQRGVDIPVRVTRGMEGGAK